MTRRTFLKLAAAVVVATTIPAVDVLTPEPEPETEEEPPP